MGPNPQLHKFLFSVQFEWLHIGYTTFIDLAIDWFLYDGNFGEMLVTFSQGIKWHEIFLYQVYFLEEIIHLSRGSE